MGALMIHARYRGECSECDRDVQATVKTPVHAKQVDEWVRCRDCGTITLAEESGTEALPGGGAECDA